MMRRVIVASVAIVATLAGCGNVQGPEDSWVDLAPNGAPYCMVDREVPEWVTVAGPVGGSIVTGGEYRGSLVKIEGDYAEEVGPDADPYPGIRYNVPGDAIVAVDGIECETT